MSTNLHVQRLKTERCHSDNNKWRGEGGNIIYFITKSLKKHTHDGFTTLFVHQTKKKKNYV